MADPGSPKVPPRAMGGADAAASTWCGTVVLSRFENAGLAAKLLFLASSVALPLAQDMKACGLGTLMVTGLLLWQGLLRRHWREIGSALLFCGAVVAIAVPGGALRDVESAARIAIALFWIMYSTFFCSLVTERRDLTDAWLELRLPERSLGAVAGFVWMVPAMMVAMREVMSAQRARGLELRPRFFFRLRFYEALIVPYVHFVLRMIFDFQVLLSLRPPEGLLGRVDRSARRRYSFVLVGCAAVPWIAEVLWAGVVRRWPGW